MIRQLPNMLNLGLRPSGAYETVDHSGFVTFHETDPGGEPLDILINPDDTPFLLRPRQFLSLLRDERASLLETARRTRKAKDKGTTDATTKTPSKRKPASKRIPAAVERQFSLLPPDVAAILRASYLATNS